jgi:cytochrome c2
MPRFSMDEALARDIVAYLTKGETAAVPTNLARAERAPGRKLLESRGCGSCHVLSGTEPLPVVPHLEPGNHQANRAIMLAPDLRFVRERFRPDKLVQWLMDPASVKPTTLMPATGLSAAEAESVAAYLLYEPLRPAPLRPLPERLPLLERRVSYAEVDEKVFHLTCRHCHSNEDIALGEGGPGNTGGFGFKPKGLNLSSYAAINSGYRDEHGERHSVFMPISDGTPRLVAAVLARQREERGEVNREVRGMPLGLPALSAEQVQILESWVAQGRPR